MTSPLLNGNLRQLFIQGQNYRQQPTTCWDDNIKEAVDAHANKWTKTEDEAVEWLLEWLKSVGDAIGRMQKLKKR